MTQGTTAVEAGFSGETTVSPRLTMRWAVRRAVLGIAILIVFIGCSAWLLHASIDPDAEGAGGAPLVAPITVPVALK